MVQHTETAISPPHTEGSGAGERRRTGRNDTRASAAPDRENRFARIHAGLATSGESTDGRAGETTAERMTSQSAQGGAGSEVEGEDRADMSPTASLTIGAEEASVAPVLRSGDEALRRGGGDDAAAPMRTTANDRAPPRSQANVSEGETPSAGGDGMKAPPRDVAAPGRGDDVQPALPPRAAHGAIAEADPFRGDADPALNRRGDGQAFGASWPGGRATESHAVKAASTGENGGAVQRLAHASSDASAPSATEGQASAGRSVRTDVSGTVQFALPPARKASNAPLRALPAEAFSGSSFDHSATEVIVRGRRQPAGSGRTAESETAMVHGQAPATKAPAGGEVLATQAGAPQMEAAASRRRPSAGAGVADARAHGEEGVGSAVSSAATSRAGITAVTSAAVEAGALHDTPPVALTVGGARPVLPREADMAISRETTETPAAQAAETRAPEQGMSAVARPTSPPATGGAETARAVAAQIAEVIGQRGGGDFEIALSPEELGRVRLGLSGAEGAMTVTVTAERPETLDLMRRHIDILAQELRELGFAKLSFSFGHDDRRGHPGAEPLPDAPVAAGNKTDADTKEKAGQPVGPGLDLRL